MVDGIPYAIDLSLKQLLKPAAVHHDVIDNLQLHACGGHWKVWKGALDAKTVQKHLQALECNVTARRQYGGKRAPPVHALTWDDPEWLIMPPWYGRLAFPNTEQPRVDAACRGYAFGAYDPELDATRMATFHGVLRSSPPQVQALQTYMEWLSCDPHRALASCAIVQMPCGAGKTPWFLKTIAELGRCALVILPSKALVEQGITAARQFLPGLKTGYLYDGRKRIARTDIVFASIQTLARHVATNEPYLSELWAQTGTVCVDEGHHVVARTFWEVMSHCPALFRIVVTATPRRKDGLFAHLQWIAGPVIFASRRVLTDAVYVLAVNYTCTAEPDRHYDVPEKRPRYGRAALAPPRHAESGENIDKLFMEDRLCRDVDRDAIISALVCRLIAEQGRNVLIVTPRSEHVQAMACRLRADLEGIASAKRAPIAVPIPIKCPVVLQSFTRRVVSVPSVQHASSVEESDTAGAAIATRTVREGKYKRRRKQDDSSAATYSSRDDALAAYQQAVEQWEDTAQRFEDVVCEVPLVGTVVEGMEEHVRLLHYHSAACIATDRMMNEGVSHPPWDTLLLLTCSPEVEQVVGRILRTCPGKKVALVVDVYSRGPGQFLKGMFMARCTKYYGPSSFTVQHVDVGEAADVTASRLSLGRFNRIAR